MLVDADRVVALRCGTGTGTISRASRPARRSPWRPAPASAARTRPGPPGRCRSSSATICAVSGIESVPYRSCILGFTNRQPMVVSCTSVAARPRRARLRHDERRPRHALHAAGDDQVGVSGADGPRRDRHARPGRSRRAGSPWRRERRPAGRRAAWPSGRRCGCPRRPGWRSRGSRRRVACPVDRRQPVDQLGAGRARRGRRGGPSASAAAVPADGGAHAGDQVGGRHCQLLDLVAELELLDLAAGGLGEVGAGRRASPASTAWPRPSPPGTPASRRR